ncbi:MAG: DUF4189 domain-containing protein [Dyella sp.]|uniref:DUF4189 domain-containing protein n=1 Tax=Dyella sp. TaxID=1869338 RepID=UPI003F7D994A
MKSLLFFALVLVATLTSDKTCAEGGCPPGLIPASGTDINSCVPIPPGYYNSPNVQKPALPPPPRWARRWGAIATDSIKGVLGAVTGLSTREDAERAALADCRAKGGNPCRPEIAYDNECAVLVVGDNGYNASADTTLGKAIEFGMHNCKESGNTNCHIYYSGCSLPKLVP